MIHIVQKPDISQRKVCKYLRINRNTHRYIPKKLDNEDELRKDIIRFANGKNIRILTVIDEFTRKCLKLKVGHCLKADAIIDPYPRYASNCSINIGDNTIICGARLFLQEDGSSISIGNSIEIGNHVWIGKDNKIGKNTRISDNSIVDWESIVTRRFGEPNVIIAGNPAQIIKRDINWDFRDLQNYKLYKQGNFK